jgi:recombinational DNA repair protein RecT
MCKKTVLIQLMKLLPKSIEIQKAVAMDETIKSKVKPDMFGVQDETDWNEKAEEADHEPVDDEDQKYIEENMKGNEEPSDELFDD